MIDIACDSTHDLIYKNHDLQLISDLDALVQSLSFRLKCFYGEWQLNTTVGVRYFQDILVKNPDLAKVESLIKSEILNTPNVNSLLSFDLNYDPINRTASITFTCDSIYGIVDVSNYSLT